MTAARVHVVAIAALVGSLLILAYLAGIAWAQAEGPVPTDPAEAGSLVYHLWKGGAIVPAILVGLFAAVSLAARKIAWLREGKRAVWAAAAVAGLAILAEPASRGTTPNLSMLISAIGAVVALILAPTKGEAK